MARRLAKPYYKIVDDSNQLFYNLVDNINQIQEGVLKINNKINDIYNLLQELSWHFGNQGFNGECCGDLSLVEFIALKRICNSNSFTIQEIGNALNFTKSGATRIIDRLENKGYVIREQSPVDGRVCCVTITPKGKETTNQIINKYTYYLEDALKDLQSDTINQIKDSLNVLVKAVQEKEMP